MKKLQLALLALSLLAEALPVIEKIIERVVSYKGGGDEGQKAALYRMVMNEWKPKA